MFFRIIQSPALVRVLPIGVFIALTLFQDSAGEAGRYWIYLAKAVLAAAALALVLPHIPEIEWKASGWSILVGIAVFALWIGLDGLYPAADRLYSQNLCPLLAKIGLAKDCTPKSATAAWNPIAAFGAGSLASLVFIVLRIVSATLLVPVIEEVFWRSFVYRYLSHRDFDREPLGRFRPVSFLLTSLFFGLEHREWLAGILCGFAYQGLVVWKNRLGDAIVAHAITNFLLGVWVVWKGAWHFW
jgi:uncharacterized protein